MGQLTSPPAEPCSACDGPISGPAYACHSCHFHLHVSCSNMPQQLQHPFHPKKSHSLMLLPKPAYPEGIFKCDACGRKGNGFSYHCSDCSIDLHILCAALPFVASVPSHHHQLCLVSSPPYSDRNFRCDVCRNPGYKTWLYHCSTCQFDVHLGCASLARAAYPQRLIMAQNLTSSIPAQQRYYVIQGVPGVPVVHNNLMMPHQFDQRAPPSKDRPDVVGSIAEGVVNAMAQNLGNAIFNGGIGGLMVDPSSFVG